MDHSILSEIKSPSDIKKLSFEELDILSAQIRDFLVEKVSKSGGHIASNLGIVELTIALLRCLDLPNDKVIFDVGHQSYVYKILTDRKDRFDSLREYGGLSGFPKRRESDFDAFNTGHSSTSISAALGMAKAYELNNDNRTVCAVIGDGSMTGGLAFEALNNASKIKRNFIIILNDNNMSISENVGGLSAHLSKFRAGSNYNETKAGVVYKLEKIPVFGKRIIKNIKKTKSSLKQLFVPGMLFENMGITYLGPFDGHDIKEMSEIIEEAKKIDHAVIIHVNTVKGKGYAPAEEHPDKFHGIDAFDRDTGLVLSGKKGRTYTDVFSDALIRAAEKDEKITAITAAMPLGTGLAAFKEHFPDRFFDVGIAEGHAVTFAAGLACAGYKPFVAIYSSFFQRAFDQILHDVCIQNLPVRLCVDRAGLVGKDGETHQGLFDLSYLSLIPNMNVFAPMNARELEEAVLWAADFDFPLAIRYPRGRAYEGFSDYVGAIEFGKSISIFRERDIALVSVGSMMETAACVREMLKEEGLNVSLINARFVKPIDEEMITSLMEDHDIIVTLEENVINGGYGMAVLRYINNLKSMSDNSAVQERALKVKVITIAAPNIYVEQGNVDVQHHECGLDTVSVYNRIKKEI